MARPHAAALTGCVVTLVLPLVGLIDARSAADVQFTDITRTAALDFQHESSATTNKYLLETMGGGVAMLDVDNDGRLDLFFTNGARIDDPQPAGKRPDKSDPRFWNRLYRQKSDGTFVDETEKAGLSGAADGVYGMGAAVGDYDNDGFADLYVTGYGGNRLYRNKGDGTFADVTAGARVAADGWSASAGFFDYDNDGRLDLFVTRYLEWSFQQNRHCGENKPGYRAYCHPDNFDPATNLLYRNNGDGTFTDVSAKAGIAAAPGKGLGVAFSDYDRDGFVDVYVANDSVQCFLYHNNRDGTFTEVGLLAGVGFNEDGKTFAGMGVDFADYDNDGHADIFVTDLSNERYRLFRQSADGSFRDATNVSRRRRGHAAVLGVEHALLRLRQRRLEGPVRGPGTRHGYHREDLAEPELPAAAAAAAQRARAFRQGPGWGCLAEGMGGTGCGIRRSGQRRRHGCRGQQRRAEGLRAAERWRQRAELAGSTNGRHAIEPRRDRQPGQGRDRRRPAQHVQHFTINTAVGYLSASDKRLLVGLGAESSAKLVEIRWPSGAVQTFDNVKVATDAGRDRARRVERAEGGAMITRRTLLAWLACSAETAFRQGVSSRSVKPQPRGKPSGRPFAARFTDVAAQAGLTHPIVYGGVDRKSYIVEVVGCGVAFLDYDNDGWLDLFVLSGTRLEGAPAETTNRLYKNNRDGTFTDVTDKAGLTRTGWASAVTVGDYDNDGFDDLFVTYYGHNVLYRNNGDGTFSDVTAKAGLRPGHGAIRRRVHVGGLQSRRAPRSVRRQLPRHHARETAQAGRERRLPLERRAGELRSARPADRVRSAVSQQWRRHVHGCQPRSPASPPPAAPIR